MHRMMNIHSKYDNMHKNRMIYAIQYTNDHVILSITTFYQGFSALVKGLLVYLELGLFLFWFRVYLFS